MKETIKSYIYSILIALGVGGLSALFTSGNMDIYEKIIRPPLSPPSILFPIVWTVLFILMGVSAAMIYNTENVKKLDRDSALLTYGISLIFNFFWSIIFFNMQMYLFAFIWLIALLYFIIKTIIKYYKINKTAAYLQLPYLLWVTFAGYLNFAVWYLNK